MRKQFDIKYRPQIESGEYKVETRDGRPAKIIYWEAKDCKPIIALIPQHLMKMEVVLRFYADGQFSSNGKKTMCDLFIVTPEEEMSDFEQEVSDIVEYCKEHGENMAKGYAKRHAKSLLSLAREQFIKDGYIIEKKAFHDAVKKVDPKVMKEVSEKWDAMKEALRIEYERGKADALKDFEAQCQSSVDNTHGLPYELGFKAGKKAGYEVGKYDTLKDLPIWKRIRDIDDLAFVENDIKLDKVIICPDKEGRMYYIYRTDLFEKLPKEDEK